jgi:hypothetical protein
MSRLTIFTLLTALAWGCVPPGPPNPIVGETRFLLTVAFKYGRKTLTFDEYLDRLLVRDDLRAKLPTGKVRSVIEAGDVEPGMTRDQVLMSLGYPPAHRTPSLSAATWTYWQNRWVTMVVAFDGDRVSRVVR